MTNTKKLIWRLSAVISGALAAGAMLIGTPAAALAAEPTTAAEARAMAQASRDRAEQYRALGGVGYKTGLVQREEMSAARYTALADQLTPPAVILVVPASTVQTTPNPICMAIKPAVQLSCP